MEALGVEVKLSEPYDWRKTLTTALKVGAYAAGGEIVAQQMGLSQALFTYLSAHGLPTQYYVIAQFALSGVFRAFEHFLANRKR